MCISPKTTGRFELGSSRAEASPGWGLHHEDIAGIDLVLADAVVIDNAAIGAFDPLLSHLTRRAAVLAGKAEPGDESKGS